MYLKVNNYKLSITGYYGVLIQRHLFSKKFFVQDKGLAS